MAIKIFLIAYFIVTAIMTVDLYFEIKTINTKCPHGYRNKFSCPICYWEGRD